MTVRANKVIFVLLALALLFTSLAAAQEKHYLILAQTQGKGSTAFADRVSESGGLVDANLEQIGVVLATSSDPNFAARLAGNSGIRAVAEDPETQWLNNERSVAVNESGLTASSLNSEPYSGYQWNMRSIRADQSAAAGYQGQGAIVAVLDSGMVLKHPDISPNINATLATSFVPGESVNPPLAPAFNHGTHVGGIIAAAINNSGTQGVAPLATLVPIKVLRTSGSGSFGWLIEGLAYAETIHADVANMSLGATFLRNPNVDCTTSTRECNAGTLISALNRAINHATQAGIFCVIAAGNEGLDLNGQYVSIPAQSGNGIAVSALGPYNGVNFDRFASYSNFGQSVVNVAAPGGDFAANNVLDYVLAPGGYSLNAAGQLAYGYYFGVGTSMAAPHVSGLAAVLVSKYGHVGPAKLKSMIENSAIDILKPGADAQSGKGRIDAVRALGLE
jgi:subtilisin family serine protease